MSLLTTALKYRQGDEASRLAPGGRFLHPWPQLSRQLSFQTGAPSGTPAVSGPCSDVTTPSPNAREHGDQMCGGWVSLSLEAGDAGNTTGFSEKCCLRRPLCAELFPHQCFSLRTRCFPDRMQAVGRSQHRDNMWWRHRWALGLGDCMSCAPSQRHGSGARAW